MSDVSAGGVLLVMAAAGYGKTTALRRRFPGAEVRWYDGTRLRASTDLARLLREPDSTSIVVDDLPPVTPTALRKAIASRPLGVAVAVATRYAVDLADRHEYVGPGQLALDEDATAELLAREFGVPDPDLADVVHQATGGWPALIRLAAPHLATVDPTGTDLAPVLEKAVGPYLEREVLGALPPAALELLRDVAGLAPVTGPLGTALGHPDADRLLAALERTGLLRPGADGLQVVPVVGAVVRAAGRARRRGRSTAAAARWYAVHGPVVAAVRAHADLDGNGAAALVDRHGDELLAAGHAALVVRVLRARPRDDLDRRALLLLGDGLRVSGEVMSAGEAYAVAARDRWDAGLAWRTGLVHYLRGDSWAALEAFDRKLSGDTWSSAADSALVLAWGAAALLQVGEADEAVDRARAAVAAAVSAGDDTALATAYVTLALCLSVPGGSTEGDELLAQALVVVGRLGDVVLRARILISQTFRLLREARYAEAADTARRASQCARDAGHTNLRLVALCNEGDALAMTGRFDAAVRQYERAISLGRRMGSRRSAAAQLGLGEVYRRRGWSEQARTAYETAVRLAEEAGNNQVLVCGLAGLALALGAGDLKAAEHAADRAVELATPGVLATALVARGSVAAHAVDAGSVGELAEQAIVAARAEGDRASLAFALELRAAVHPDGARVHAALREALAIWTDAGAEVEAARIACLIGDLRSASTDDRLAALIAAETLAAVGAVRPVAPAVDRAGTAVAIRVFGRFEVLLDGVAVPAGQWQSRKARDLLRILVARRGRPVSRDELSELLWPDDRPDRTGHRLSVLLSIVRGVFDPCRALAVDHYLVADQSSVVLNVHRIDIDVESFLAEVSHGRGLRERGADTQAYTLLAAAEARYRADVFEDEPYADWALPLREQARAAYVHALRLLASTAGALGDPAAATAYLLRLLTLDPYDEGAYAALVRTHSNAGQHGEAQRAYRRYRKAMTDIGVRPTFQYQDPMQRPKAVTE